jgi:hypothetical protein
LFINEEDRLSSFNEFLQRFSSSKLSLKESWNIYEQPDGVCLYHLKSEENFCNITMSFKILINNKLLVSIYHNENEADIKELNWILKNSKLEFWSQFLNLANHYQTEPIVELGCPKQLLKHALHSLNKISQTSCIQNMIVPLKETLKLSLNLELRISELPSLKSAESFSEVEPTAVIYKNFDTAASKNFKDKATNRQQMKKPTTREKKYKQVKMKKVFSEPSKFICSRCDKVFNSKMQFSKHRHVRPLSYR